MILVGVRYVQTDLQSRDYNPGHQIKATAEGRPAPTFLWTWLSGGGPASVSGDTLTITEAMKGSNIYNCTASNTLVNGNVMNQTTTVSFTVTGKTTILVLSIYFGIHLQTHSYIALIYIHEN